MAFDYGSKFRYALGEIREIHGVECKRSGAQHHSALGKVKRYNEPIRRTL